MGWLMVHPLAAGFAITAAGLVAVVVVTVGVVTVWEWAEETVTRRASHRAGLLAEVRRHQADRR